MEMTKITIGQLEIYENICNFKPVDFEDQLKLRYQDPMQFCPLARWK